MRIHGPLIAALLLSSCAHGQPGFGRAAPTANREQALDDLESILQPTVRQGPLNRIPPPKTFVTKGFAVGGLPMCGRDVVRLGYVRTKGSPNAEPLSISAERQYHFLSVPSETTEPAYPPPPRPTNECERAAADDGAGWFSGSVDDALQGYAMFRLTLAAARSNPKLVTCEDPSVCIPRLLGLERSLRFEEFQRWNDGAQRVDVIEVEGLHIEVRTRRPDRGIAPAAIESIRLSEVVVLV